MIDMLKRHEIQVLRKAGHTQADVAERTEVSESAVRRVEREPMVKELNESAERQRRGIPRNLGMHAGVPPPRGLPRAQKARPRNDRKVL